MRPSHRGAPTRALCFVPLLLGENAQLYLTDRSRAVYVPTTAGYSLLLSPADPDRYLSAVRAMAR